MKIKPAGKIIILLLVVGGAIGLWRLFSGGGDIMAALAPPADTKASVVPIRADLPTAASEAAASGTLVQSPGSELAQIDKPGVRFLIWAWNSQLGGLYSNGGPVTTEGSLMAKQGVKVEFTRQDDVSKMQEELVTFATELSKGNKQPEIGAHFVAIMGDGGAAFLQGINPVLKKLGTGYTAKVVGSMGYSRGEDKFMGPAAWKVDPNKAMGGVVAGYLRDGD